MKLIISNSSSVPIYLQIKTSIIEQIMNEELKEGEMLPSIRALAKDIKISVMTIKKAYDELEQEGYILSVQGKGSYVSEKKSLDPKEKARIDIETHLSEIIEISKKYKISKEEILEAFELLYGGEEQ